MHAGIPVIIISLLGLGASSVLARQFKAYGRGDGSPLDFLQGKYFLGFLVMATIAGVSSAAITFLLGLSLIFFGILMVAMCVFGLVMLMIGARRHLQ